MLHCINNNSLALQKLFFQRFVWFDERAGAGDVVSGLQDQRARQNLSKISENSIRKIGEKPTEAEAAMQENLKKQQGQHVETIALEKKLEVASIQETALRNIQKLSNVDKGISDQAFQDIDTAKIHALRTIAEHETVYMAKADLTKQEIEFEATYKVDPPNYYDAGLAVLQQHLGSLSDSISGLKSREVPSQALDQKNALIEKMSGTYSDLTQKRKEMIERALQALDLPDERTEELAQKAEPRLVDIREIQRNVQELEQLLPMMNEAGIPINPNLLTTLQERVENGKRVVREAGQRFVSQANSPALQRKWEEYTQAVNAYYEAQNAYENDPSSTNKEKLSQFEKTRTDAKNQFQLEANGHEVEYYRHRFSTSTPSMADLLEARRFHHQMTNDQTFRQDDPDYVAAIAIQKKPLTDMIHQGQDALFVRLSAHSPDLLNQWRSYVEQLNVFNQTVNHDPAIPPERKAREREEMTRKGYELERISYHLEIYQYSDKAGADIQAGDLATLLEDINGMKRLRGALSQRTTQLEQAGFHDAAQAIGAQTDTLSNLILANQKSFIDLSGSPVLQGNYNVIVQYADRLAMAREKLARQKEGGANSNTLAFLSQQVRTLEGALSDQRVKVAELSSKVAAGNPLIGKEKKNREDAPLSHISGPARVASLQPRGENTKS